MDMLVGGDFLDCFPLGLGLLKEQFGVESMLLLDLSVEFVSNLFAELVRAQRDPERVGGNAETVGEGRLDLVVDVVHAEIIMLELGVLDRHPDSHSFSVLVFLGNLLDVVQLRHWFFRLFARLELLVFLDYLVSVFEGGELVLDLVLWKWELAEQA